MNRDTLHRFFAGKLSMQEGLSIKQWMESSKENERIFLQERRLFDALLLHDEHKQMQPARNFQLRKLALECMKVAAVALLTLACYGLYQNMQWNNEEVKMYTVSVPAGQRTHLTLPDGTTVWLNARTTFSYPTSFNSNERTVFLQGEAYFEVSKNLHKPFIVQTQQYNIEVLGTKFDVEAYPDSKNFETTLMQGSVKVSSPQNPEQSLTLKPNEKVFLKDGVLTSTQVSDFSSYRWKEGLICFKNIPFEYVMEEFEKYYGMKIVVKNKSVHSYSYTGKFRQTDGIDYALNVLQRDIYFKYEKDTENQIIYIN